MPLYVCFIDLTKAFDLVSRDGLFKVLPKIGCPPKLQSMIESFHTDTKGRQTGCVLAPTLLGIFFGMLLKHAFGITSE